MQTYKIHSSKLGKLHANLQKINNKAAKLGFDPIIVNVIGSKNIERVNPDTGIKVVDHYDVITVSGTAPVIDGFEFIASIEHVNTGNIIYKVPGVDVDIPVEFWTASPNCVHCGIDRYRKDTFILKDDCGIIQVGRNCLQDFIRSDSAINAIKLMDLYSAFHNSLEEFGSGSGSFSGFNVFKYLATVNYLISNYGWVSSKTAFETGVRSTATEAYQILIEETNGKSFNTLSEFDFQTAENAIKFVKEFEAKSDYENNLKNIIALGYIDSKHCGFAASAILFYKRGMEKAILDSLPKKESNYFGKVGDKIKVNAEILMTKTIESGYGFSTLIGFIDQDGNIFKWFASGHKDVKIGDKVVLSGTVKSHSEFNGKKETLLTRCKILTD